MCKWGTYKIIEIQERKVVVDSCIADLILKLNKLGIKTTGSCCGHNENPLSILFRLNGKVYEITEYKIKRRKLWRIRGLLRNIKYSLHDERREDKKPLVDNEKRKAFAKVYIKINEILVKRTKERIKKSMEEI